ncbi:MAG TPA: RDD family protein [Pyrinomonadaceae bacterium]|jgi:uncharacterized RDD family membrane protein YckC|nr:RDD family protein [Pyrinomonadaceae bacterium]
MAAAEAKIAPRSDSEKIINFSPEWLRAPFALRCAAIFVDYTFLLIVPVAWLVLARFLSDTGVPDGIGKTVWTLGVLLFVVDFLLLPMLSNGQSFGKMLVGIRIVRIDGARVDATGILKRNLLGYLLTGLTVGLGFLLAAVNNSGRALHDYVGGTVVIRGRKTPI